MMAPDIVSTAVERGILRPDQAAALTALAQELASSSPASALGAAPVPGAEPVPEPVPDDEKLRFIGGFNDIFVSIGISLFIGAIVLLLGEHAGSLATSVAVAAASWVLAELFSRKRRMALPSILLLAAFSSAVFTGLVWTIALVTDNATAGDSALWPPELMWDAPLTTVAAALLTAALTAVHYWRFRVPVTVAAGVASLCLAVFAAIVMAAPEWGMAHVMSILLCGGLAVFALAMRFDLGDLERTSRRTDIAFWLHLLAASMIVHPIVTVVAGEIDFSDLDKGTALTVLATLAVLSLVALVIDRRAILSAGLIYAGFAFYSLIEKANFSSSTFSLSVLALGAYVLMISALWRPMRNGLLSLLPDSLARRLPRPAPSRA